MHFCAFPFSIPNTLSTSLCALSPTQRSYLQHSSQETESAQTVHGVVQVCVHVRFVAQSPRPRVLFHAQRVAQHSLSVLQRRPPSLSTHRRDRRPHIPRVAAVHQLVRPPVVPALQRGLSVVQPLLPLTRDFTPTSSASRSHSCSASSSFRADTQQNV